MCLKGRLGGLAFWGASHLVPVRLKGRFAFLGNYLSLQFFNFEFYFNINFIPYF